jgi:PhzF family phenazine biosynthesis protein
VEITLYQVDAFTSRVFGGNPAAVCPLDAWLPTDVMQAIGLENNLSETAFFVAADDGDHDFHIRWFTPLVEMDLAGHPTLATAHVILEHLEWGRESVRFRTGLGDTLVVERIDGRLAMDFPARPPAPATGLDGLPDALGAEPLDVLAARDGFAVFADEETVRGLTPDMGRLAALDRHGFIVTVPGKDCDFVSRVLAPAVGIPEDPVTGSAHCTLIPYWAERLGKGELFARQVSSRGGELWCEDRGERVGIAGHAVTFMEGTIRL